MFEYLGSSVQQILGKLGLTKTVNRRAVEDIVMEIRKVLLDSDAPMLFVNNVSRDIEKNILGIRVKSKTELQSIVIKILMRNITDVIGNEFVGIDLQKDHTNVILLCGLQGSGKTSFCIKLANLINNKTDKKLKIGAISLDITRFAAQEQLKILCDQNNITFVSLQNSTDIANIVRFASEVIKSNEFDILFIDTAGRNYVNKESIAELKMICNALQPTEKLLVVDSVVGQNIVNVANIFNESIDITGIILTKTDSDAKCGSAIGARLVTGKPIKYLSCGEKVGDIEEFHPHKIINKVFRDISLNEIYKKVKTCKNFKIDSNTIERLSSNVELNFNDLFSQIEGLRKASGLMKVFTSAIIKKRQKNDVSNKAVHSFISTQLAIINAMTKEERLNYRLLIDNNSRVKRIANGTGVSAEDVQKIIARVIKLGKFYRNVAK